MPITDASGHTETFWIRVKTVSTYLLNNQEYLSSKRAKQLSRVVMDEFDLEESQCGRIIREAKKEINQLYSKNVERKIQKALRDREEQIRELKHQLDECKKPAEKARFHALILQACKDRDELCGLYEKKEKAPAGEVLNLNVDYSKLNQRQLQRLAAGEDIKAVLTDTDNSNANNSSDKSEG